MNNIIPSQYAKGYIPQQGDMYHDSNTGLQMIWHNNSWKTLAIADKKKQRMFEQLKDEKMEDILDTMLALLIRANIVKDVDEFKEIMEANKLASELSNN
ncbi:MAG: hypothetical protein K0R18_47 [Bacillales bacterium]|jgi:hypothetical protein|nr:hypothetical protein [Bacillales bacterium]